jgi:SAM-dependent methyltransferase
MKPATMDEVLDLLQGSYTSAALGAALELGLFWLVEERPLKAEEIGAALDVPGFRCRYWLQLLEDAGLLDRTDEGYAPSPVARTAIMGAYSRETWAFLAHEAREAFPVLRDLALHIRNPGSVMTALGGAPPNYVTAMAGDAERARRFTRMLYEIHQPLAKAIAASLDLAGVERVMDLGGGSGVVSIALLAGNPRSEAVVVDINAVCRAGAEIARETPARDRITYHPADFLKEDWPGGFDMVIECDVGEYGSDLFRRVRRALKPDGRFVIIDQFPAAVGQARPGQLYWAFERSLADPGFHFATAEEVIQELKAAGFVIARQSPLTVSNPKSKTLDQNHILIESRVAPRR